MKKKVLSENKPQKESELETGHWALSDSEDLSFRLQGARWCPEYFLLLLRLLIEEHRPVLFIALEEEADLQAGQMGIGKAQH